MLIGECSTAAQHREAIKDVMVYSVSTVLIVIVFVIRPVCSTFTKRPSGKQRTNNMTSYSNPNAARGAAVDMDAYLKHVQDSIEGESPVASAFTRPVNLRTNETFTAVRTVDFNHSLQTLASDPDARQWTSHPGQQFLAQGDKIVTKRVTVIGVRNSTNLPLGIKFGNLDINRPHIIGSHYKNTDIDLLLPPQTAQTTSRDLYRFSDSDVAAALHPSVVNSNLADMTEESLDAGILESSPEFGGNMVDSTTQLGQQIAQLYNNGSIRLGPEFKVIASQTPNAPSLFLISMDLTDKIKSHILSERKKLPFRDPAEVSAQLVRMDGHTFDNAEGLIDRDTPLETFQSETALQIMNQISVDIEEEYIVARAQQ